MSGFQNIVFPWNGYKQTIACSKLYVRSSISMSLAPNAKEKWHLTSKVRYPTASVFAPESVVDSYHIINKLQGANYVKTSPNCPFSTSSRLPVVRSLACGRPSPVLPDRTTPPPIGGGLNITRNNYVFVNVIISNRIYSIKKTKF